MKSLLESGFIIMNEGYIKYLNAKGHYGFIDCAELEMENIFFHFSNCKKSYQNIFIGDKVLFELKALGEKGVEAASISFIRNASLDGLKRDFNNGKILKGFLKFINGCYFVKDSETNILIKIVISSYEINLKEVYDDNLNKSIEYKIVLFTSKNRVRAINLNRRVLPIFENLKIGFQLQGVVQATVKGGFRIELSKGLNGFLPKSLVKRSGKILQIGDSIDVTCLNIEEHLENIIVDLTESFEKDNLHSQMRKEQITSARPGDKYNATIKSVVSYGFFVRCEYFEGLLHVKHLVPSNFDFSNNKKEFTRLLKDFFLINLNISVVCEENSNDRVNFKLDLSQSENLILISNFHTYIQQRFSSVG